MTITIQYFGMFAEATGCHEETLDSNAVLVEELLSEIYQKYPSLENLSFKIAQGNQLVQLSSKLDGQSLAFLPPFSGG